MGLRFHNLGWSFTILKQPAAEDAAFRQRRESSMDDYASLYPVCLEKWFEDGLQSAKVREYDNRTGALLRSQPCLRIEAKKLFLQGDFKHQSGLFLRSLLLLSNVMLFEVTTSIQRFFSAFLSLLPYHEECSMLCGFFTSDPWPKQP